MNTTKNNNNSVKDINIKETLSSTFIEKLKLEKTTFVPARSSTLPIALTNKILTQIETQFELGSRDEAISVLAVLFQQGDPLEVVMVICP